MAISRKPDTKLAAPISVKDRQLAAYQLDQLQARHALGTHANGLLKFKDGVLYSKPGSADDVATRFGNRPAAERQRDKTDAARQRLCEAIDHDFGAGTAARIGLDAEDRVLRGSDLSQALCEGAAAQALYHFAVYSDDDTENMRRTIQGMLPAMRERLQTEGALAIHGTYSADQWKWAAKQVVRDKFPAATDNFDLARKQVASNQILSGAPPHHQENVARTIKRNMLALTGNAGIMIPAPQAAAEVTDCYVTVAKALTNLGAFPTTNADTDALSRGQKAVEELLPTLIDRSLVGPHPRPSRADAASTLAFAFVLRQHIDHLPAPQLAHLPDDIDTAIGEWMGTLAQHPDFARYDREALDLIKQCLTRGEQPTIANLLQQRRLAQLNDPTISAAQRQSVLTAATTSAIDDPTGSNPSFQPRFDALLITLKSPLEQPRRQGRLDSVLGPWVTQLRAVLQPSTPTAPGLPLDDDAATDACLQAFETLLANPAFSLTPDMKAVMQGIDSSQRPPNVKEALKQQWLFDTLATQILLPAVQRQGQAVDPMLGIQRDAGAERIARLLTDLFNPDNLDPRVQRTRNAWRAFAENAAGAV
ncbi:MAG: hypothetical protein KF871_14715 [Hydrogenophaga sp.]|nr:hypothetical protein [Hydrogenophaga sp.]